MRSVVSVLPDWPATGPLPERPEGTAVAVLPGGYLATNVHVLGRATGIRIRLEDGRVLDAEIVGRDRLTDIALIRAPIELPVPAFAGPPALGAPVCTVGNQFGLGLSVTCGVVSATGRSATGFNPVEDFIQTDAAVNPGASGGALVDADGRLVGLVSAIFTKQSDANIGVNFAASIALVMRVAEDLAAHGSVRRARAGLRVADPRLDERAKGAGARVVAVTPGGAAERAGLSPGDVITRMADRAIRGAGDVVTAIYLGRIGDTLEIAFRRDGAPATTRLTLTP
jgi:S1-C subfamily serine protease